MLESLTILNGTISPNFNKYNFIYTVYVKDVHNLEIEYIKEFENDIINIVGNENITTGENIVTIHVNDNYYTLYVYKETEESVNKIDEYISKIEASSRIVGSKLTAPLIGSGAFILILIFFYLLFLKGKHN